jgi:hypothetical protein
MTIREVNVNMANLELAAPFSKKKMPYQIAINQYKTFDTVKSLRTIFKKPEKLHSSATNLKEIIITPDSVRAYQPDTVTPVMRKTFTSSTHNMFRIKPMRLHLAMQYRGGLNGNGVEL